MLPNQGRDKAIRKQWRERERERERYVLNLGLECLLCTIGTYIHLLLVHYCSCNERVWWHDTMEWDDKISLYELKVAMSLSNLTAVGVLIWKIRSQSSKFATKKVDEIGKEGFILGMRLYIWVVLPVKRVPRECHVHNSYTHRKLHTTFSRGIFELNQGLVCFFDCYYVLYLHATTLGKVF